MSPLSNPERPYKSQIFNLINRQFFRLRDRAQIGLRQLKTATVWGMQLLAYPLYLLVQTSTQLGKQLQFQAAQLLSSSQQENRSSVGSQPTIVALNSLHPWLEQTPYQLLSLAETEVLSQKQALVQENTGKITYFIQGIATYLENGKLVLVTTDNQTIDLLSDSQHEQLKQRIKILLECYEQIQQPWWWRIASQGNKGQFHPLRWLSNLIIWIQTSSLAKRLNLFQESQLTVSSGYSEISQTPPQSSSQASNSGFLARLDRALAGWETTQITPIIETIKHWRQKLDQQDSRNSIVSLIQAAVDYFYGVTSQTRLTGDTNCNAGSGLSHETWLTKADLFGDNDSPQPLAATENNDDFSVAVANQLSGDIASATTTPQTSTGNETEATKSETTGNALPTEAIPMGYEKHILARILEWIDRALAWLEQRLMTIWKWLRQQLK